MLAGANIRFEPLFASIASVDEDPLAALAIAAPEITRAVDDAVGSHQLSAATPDQLTFVLRYLEENPRIARDTAFGVAAATTTDPELQLAAVNQIKAAGRIADVWLELAESMVPAASDAASEYLESLTDAEQIRNAVLLSMDSGVPAVRDLGIDIFERQPDLQDDQSLWSSLAESDDQQVQVLVAQHARYGGQVADAALARFDRHVLIARRHNRRAKQLVKDRLDDAAASATEVSPERLAALLNLARGNAVQDREWALMRLATLAISGVDIDGVTVSLTSQGGAK